VSAIDQLFLSDLARKSPQGRAGQAIFLLMTDGPMGASALKAELGYNSRDAVYKLMDNLARSVPLYYDEQSGVFGILES
jgi:hypothetical protein